MGEVYRAADLRLGQPVTLKFLPDAVGADAVRLAQFHNEVRTARQISHPNICRVYDIGEIDGHCSSRWSSSTARISRRRCAVLRWGLTTLAVGVLTADLMLVTPATASLSAWYPGSTIFLTAITVGLATWGFVTSIRGQRSRVNWLG